MYKLCKHVNKIVSIQMLHKKIILLSLEVVMMMMMIRICIVLKMFTHMDIESRKKR